MMCIIVYRNLQHGEACGILVTFTRDIMQPDKFERCMLQLGRGVVQDELGTTDYGAFQGWGI